MMSTLEFLATIFALIRVPSMSVFMFLQSRCTGELFSAVLTTSSDPFFMYRLNMFFTSRNRLEFFPANMTSCFLLFYISVHCLNVSGGVAWVFTLVPANCATKNSRFRIVHKFFKLRCSCSLFTHFWSIFAFYFFKLSTQYSRF